MKYLYLIDEFHGNRLDELNFCFSQKSRYNCRVIYVFFHNIVCVVTISI